MFETYRRWTRPRRVPFLVCLLAGALIGLWPEISSALKPGGFERLTTNLNSSAWRHNYIPLLTLSVVFYALFWGVLIRIAFGYLPIAAPLVIAGAIAYLLAAVHMISVPQMYGVLWMLTAMAFARCGIGLVTMSESTICGTCSGAGQVADYDAYGNRAGSSTCGACGGSGRMSAAGNALFRILFFGVLVSICSLLSYSCFRTNKTPAELMPQVGGKAVGAKVN